LIGSTETFRARHCIVSEASFLNWLVLRDHCMVFEPLPLYTASGTKEEAKTKRRGIRSVSASVEPHLKKTCA